MSLDYQINNQTMYFGYLNLPLPPRPLLLDSLPNLDLIDVDPRLDEINAGRAPNNRSTGLNQGLKDWLSTHIFSQFQRDDVDIIPPLLSRTTTVDHPDDIWKNSHTRHVDIGRNYAVNYYMQTGAAGEFTGNRGTVIEWWDSTDHRLKLAKADKIKRHSWAMLKVDIPHSVRYIHHNRLYLTFSINPKDPNFDPVEAYRHLFVPDSIIDDTNPGI